MATTANAADITVTDAKISGGKLVITGTTATPRTNVRLDGQTGKAFNKKSNAAGAFTFELVYLPSDCIVTLQKLTGTSTLGAPTDAVVMDCGPRGVSPRGAWKVGTPYLTDDLVTYQGSTWRAKRNNTGKQPVVGANWEKFAAKGARGPRGVAGPAGPTGATGVVAIKSIGGDGGTVAGSATAGNWAFVGPTVQFTVDGTQRLTGSITTSGKFATITGINDQGICRRLSGDTGTPTMLADFLSVSIGLNLSRMGQSASAIPPAGTWDVGFCTANIQPETLAMDYVYGWVMLTN